MNIRIDYQTLNANCKRRIERQYRVRSKRMKIPRTIHRIIATLVVVMLAVLLVAQVALPSDLRSDVIIDQSSVDPSSDNAPAGTNEMGLTSEDMSEPVLVGEAVPLDPDADMSAVSPSMGGSGGGFFIK